MGYYTRYTLTIQNDGLDEVDWLLQEAKIRLTEIPNDYGTYGALIDGDLDDCKWYDHDKDMKAISKEYPNVLFTLEGDGEEQGDQWITYYKGGKYQHCKAIITFDKYDPKKLREYK